MHLQVKEEKKIRKQILKLDLFTTPDKSFFGSSHHPLPREISLFATAKGWTKKTYFKMYWFKSTLTPTTFLQCTFSRIF